MYIHVYVCVCIYIYISFGARRQLGAVCFSQACTIKGIRPQGTVLKHRSSLQKSLCPVVICPYLCSSDSGRSLLQCCLRQVCARETSNFGTEDAGTKEMSALCGVRERGWLLHGNLRTDRRLPSFLAISRC